MTTKSLTDLVAADELSVGDVIDTFHPTFDYPDRVVGIVVQIIRCDNRDLPNVLPAIAVYTSGGRRFVSPRRHASLILRVNE